jgi:hypothetical protein
MRWMVGVLVAGLVCGAASTESTWLLYPDPDLTPGQANDPPTPLATLCSDHYTASVRHVTEATKRHIYERYGLFNVTPGEAEIDHDIPLGLDGTNDEANLWPQSYLTPGANAYAKDILERKLHYMVCRGELSLKAAQGAIVGDWRPAYEQYIGPLQ